MHFCKKMRACSRDGWTCALGEAVWATNCSLVAPWWSVTEQKEINSQTPSFQRGKNPVISDILYVFGGEVLLRWHIKFGGSLMNLMTSIDFSGKKKPENWANDCVFPKAVHASKHYLWTGRMNWSWSGSISRYKRDGVQQKKKKKGLMGNANVIAIRLIIAWAFTIILHRFFSVFQHAYERTLKTHEIS